MTPPHEGTGSRGRRKSHNACLPCRRKKSRCPGEKPACSSCTRLNQPCSYAPAMVPPARGGRSDERLAKLEEKLDRILSRDSGLDGASRQRSNKDIAIDDSDDTYSPSSMRERSVSVSHTSPVVFGDAGPSSYPRPAATDISRAIQIYFQRCHRQPVWCFEREDVRDQASLPDELVYSILALTSRFFSVRRAQLQRYGNDARRLIMLRVANGSVALATIESLCLLSHSSFTDGNISLGQFYLGLADQLCRSARLDTVALYSSRDPKSERKRRLFWSLQLLEQFYGRQTGLLSALTDVGRPFDPATSEIHGSHVAQSPKPPSLPRDELGYGMGPNEPGIWNTGVYLGWVWSRVRKYVSDCAQNILKEPWRHDSMYARVSSDFMETENRIPMCHRYDSIKFYERDINDLQMNHDYWAPWLKEQFTYHVVPTVLNHPFLYIVGAQHNPNLAIPNTFWKRSSELALLHATWIVRIIDMIVDKQVPLTDPFFGHVAAIAATVHLYYCCAAAARLKEKSHTDFAKCRKFLQGFLPFSPACVALDRNLDKMTRIASSGTEEMDAHDWMPSRIYLSVPLMWDVLQFNCAPDSQEASVAGNLLDPSLAPPKQPEPELAEDSLLEIVVATSPEITVDTRDGGQEVPSFSWRAPQTSAPTPRSSSRSMMMEVTSGGTFDQQQSDTLTFNTTPWLYADPSQVLSLGDIAQWNDPTQNNMSDSRGAPWWEEGTFNNAMFR
ncbi:hypothetical protein Micbo1qcDRAFT_237374 [Microdochium bolleyi]|uniref:Zn(2)-C6 fungal-type domain-containing protein n=1 Tax=Microdochium bolleyi TaxID=196109 RepID=A0A136IL67_9PEZI|nr:hypothetical protein Micbo1qcDRAFT_237374 [Microdochium bolleyi]